ncbi:LysR substrate-binding domain-containing protein [Pseudomonas jinjuensis]|uniref:DNA-binding transcriptional regulator, LysR family n=1 Tax=Pseudomonas jinjuensis TaxID=198616 RepID=A0A1H0H513_9PSED|nr:LysR substrate-binding domain-containing protein [Pseudomonas jinjuensis]SDO14229.1 DNA-binding transcriptional regulator, LysR family [Pseudomonas jinjuensis]
MKLHQLQALVASAETGSIRGAARSLGISQAAVTRALRELEDAQQLPLFVRTPSGLSFTESGKVLLTHARLVQKQLERAQQDLDQLRGAAMGRLCVGITPWVSLTFLPEVVLAFRERMPEVRLELFESLMAVAQPLLRDGSMDFAVGQLQPSLASQEFSSEALLAYQTAVLLRQGHPRQDCRSIHDLLDQDWALNYAPDGHDALMEELFWRHGARIDERRIVRAHSLAISQYMVERADMCTWGPAILTGAPPFLGRLVSPPLVERCEPRHLSIVKRRNGTLSASAMCFVDCLLQVIRRHARSARREDRQLFETLELLV